MVGAMVVLQDTVHTNRYSKASSSKAWSIQICGIPYETLCSMFMLQQLFESLCTQGETGHALLYVCPSKPFAVLTFTLQSARIL